MERIDKQVLTEAILMAPGWARVGITMPDPHLREQAADALAAVIVEKLAPSPTVDRNQLALPLP
jgi:hypothetical protein